MRKMERLIEGITKKGRNATEKTKRGRKGQQGASSYKLQPSPLSSWAMPQALDQICVQMELAGGVVSLFPI